MELIADIFLAAGALGAGFYCFILGKRLNRFNDLEKGVGGAVAVLSAQVDDLTKTLSAAQITAAQSAQTLSELTARAQEASRRLELQMASLHDIPSPPPHEVVPLAKAAPAPVAPISTVAARNEPMFVRHRSLGGTA